MDTQVSTPIKIFAAVGLLLAIGFGAMTMMKGGSSPSPAAAPVTPVVHHPSPAPAATTPATTHPTTAPSHPAPAPSTHPHPTAPATHPPAAHPAATTPAAHTATPATHAPAPSTKKPAVKPAHHAKPLQHLPPVAADGLPTPLDMLLHIHQVVVVAVYDPEIPTDALFVGEAQAGARDAHAGFLAVSVLNERVAAPLTAAAGHGELLPSPGLLIYKQPAVLMNTITGFVDRAAVAAAVANALVATAPSQPAATPTTTTTP